MNIPLRVLLVEDSENDAMLVKRSLENGGCTFDSIRVDNETAMRDALKAGGWDIVLCDYNMPGFGALQALELIKKTESEIPIIIVSGSIGEDLAVEALKAGANDYVMKDKLQRLVPAIKRELEDVEVRKAKAAAEEQLKAGERVRALGSAAASVLHDLKNPLQVISSCTELLQSIELPPDDHAKYLRVIGEQVERMVEMTHEVLDFARGQLVLTPEAVDLSALCRWIINSFTVLAEQKRVHLQFTERTVDNASPTFNIDRLKIVRGLINILDNARSATPPGGTIHMRLNLRTDGAVISIEDTGPGISEEIISKIFDPFVTHGKPQGTGLGLCITKNIIEGHGGTITAESYHGSGTRFTIALPRQSGKENLSEMVVGFSGQLA